MTDLSPAAQAVMDAADEVFARGGRIRDGHAAALRALAVRINGADDLRQDVLDIAAELEA